MNMPPECEHRECMGIGRWTVLDKTTGKIKTACERCVGEVLRLGHTYSIYPAKDYSIHGGHDLPASRKCPVCPSTTLIEGPSGSQVCGMGHISRPAGTNKGCLELHHPENCKFEGYGECPGCRTRYYIQSGERKSSRVDAELFGPHSYPGAPRKGEPGWTSDCGFGCKCWAGPSNSGGPVDPFGPCPHNPIPAEPTERKKK